MSKWSFYPTRILSAKGQSMQISFISLTETIRLWRPTRLLRPQWYRMVFVAPTNRGQSMSLKCALVGAVAYLQANALFNPFFPPFRLSKLVYEGVTLRRTRFSQRLLRCWKELFQVSVGNGFQAVPLLSFEESLLFGGLASGALEGESWANVFPPFSQLNKHRLWNKCTAEGGTK